MIIYEYILKIGLKLGDITVGRGFFRVVNKE